MAFYRGNPAASRQKSSASTVAEARDSARHRWLSSLLVKEKSFRWPCFLAVTEIPFKLSPTAFDPLSLDPTGIAMLAAHEAEVVWQHVRWHAEYRDVAETSLIVNPDLNDPGQNKQRWKILARKVMRDALETLSGTASTL